MPQAESYLIFPKYYLFIYFFLKNKDLKTSISRPLSKSQMPAGHFWIVKWTLRGPTLSLAIVHLKHALKSHRKLERKYRLILLLREKWCICQEKNGIWWKSNPSFLIALYFKEDFRHLQVSLTKCMYFSDKKAHT